MALSSQKLGYIIFNKGQFTHICQLNVSCGQDSMSGIVSCCKIFRNCLTKAHFTLILFTSNSASSNVSCVPIKTHSQYAITIEIDRLVMSILGSLEIVHFLLISMLINFHHIVSCDR
jgi:hypothetical protein